MTDPFARLLEGASEPLGPPEVTLTIDAGDATRELTELLAARNGFYALGSSLHVFPSPPSRENHDIETWNAPDLWRDEYGDMADGHVFFGEDAFGNQFSLYDGRVVMFDAETARIEKLANDVPGWVERIVADHRVLTGWPVAIEWQERHGPLPPGKRLLPVKPFVLGGDYVVENLRAVDAVEGMRYRGYVAQRLRGVPDGTPVELRPAPTG